MNEYEKLSPLALAFMGDAIHTAFVRKEVLKGQVNTQNNYHNLAKKFCNAEAQAKTLDIVLNDLDDEEKNIVRRARNSHPKHTAKNFDTETYKKATAFEALIGFLFLTEREERLHEILKISVKGD